MVMQFYWNFLHFYVVPYLATAFIHSYFIASAEKIILTTLKILIPQSIVNQYN